MPKVRIALNLVLLAILCGCIENGSPEREGKNQPFTVQFGWTFDAHHAGFLVAKRLGYYLERGLDVTLLPGGLDSSPIRTLLSGGANLAQVSGAEQLIAARIEHLPIIAVAAFHRSSPHAVISLARRPIRSGTDLKQARIAVAFGDTAEFLLRDLIADSGVDSRTVELVPFRFDLRPLINGQVDAVTGFSTDQPHTLRAQGVSPVVLRYSDLRPIGYGYMFVARASKGGGTAEFLSASRKGWQKVFENPEAALDLLTQEVRGLNRSVEGAKLRAVRQLMMDEKGDLDSWCMNGEAIEAALRRMKKYQQVSQDLDITQLFTNSYCER